MNPNHFNDWLLANPRFNGEGYQSGRQAALSGGSKDLYKKAIRYKGADEYVSDYYLSWVAGYLIGHAERNPHGTNKTD